jgi:hypothetical protein
MTTFIFERILPKVIVTVSNEAFSGDEGDVGDEL